MQKMFLLKHHSQTRLAQNLKQKHQVHLISCKIKQILKMMSQNYPLKRYQLLNKYQKTHIVTST